MRFREEGLGFDAASQKARVWSESWVEDHLYCPACGRDRISRFRNNTPVADFVCPACDEEFELKAKKSALGARIPDGAFTTMIERLEANNNPSLLLMRYDQGARSVVDLSIVPKHFFVKDIIRKRKPLADTAKRAGWIGCDIVLSGVPAVGRIEIVRSGSFIPKADVLAKWRETAFLSNKLGDARGWLVEVMRCVEQIGRDSFDLADVYRFEDRLAAIYPGNQHVREKIRQQLQVLRDNGFLASEGGGRYRRLVG
jgi:type II restriction enzyme